jgi:RNA polymerase sigma-70 factor (ECF subfamily)
MRDLDETLRRVRAGDRDAYGAIVAAYQDMLLAYAAFRLPDPALVDEVVQQTFIRAYEQIADFRSGHDFGTWLRTICRFMILAELKRHARDRENRAGYRDALRAGLLDQALAAAENAPESDALAALRRCMGKLQETSRTLVAFRYQKAQKVEEIAREVGQSAAWVATTLFRIRETLRACVEQEARA